MLFDFTILVINFQKFDITFIWRHGLFRSYLWCWMRSSADAV